jgi:hypothetical protein
MVTNLNEEKLSYKNFKMEVPKFYKNQKIPAEAWQGKEEQGRRGIEDSRPDSLCGDKTR